MIDWGLARLQHEMFGRGFREIAEEHDVSVSVVKYTAEQEEWSQKPIAKTLNQFFDTSDIADVDEGLLDDVAMRLKVLHTLKSSALNPRYIEVEATLLQKCLDFLTQVDTSQLAAAEKIKAIAETLKMLTGKSASSGGPAEDGKGSLTVKILNKVDRTTGDTATAMEVQIAGVGAN